MQYLRPRMISLSAFILAVHFVAFGCSDSNKSDAQPDVGAKILAQDGAPIADTAAKTQRAPIDANEPGLLPEGVNRRQPISEGDKTSEIQRKTAKENLMQEYKTPQGVIVRLTTEHDPWADAVASFQRGKSAPKKNANPWNAMGKPSGHSFALGHGGVLVVQFIDNVLVEGPGPDLVIFEVGKAIEPTKIEISENGTDWVTVSRAGGSKSTIDIGPFVKPGQRFKFVRLTDVKSGKSKGSDTPGADINGVGALNSAPVLDAPSRKEIERLWKR